ncbi:BnaC03g30430D [Brassica napus]|uniref:BnaC03g30430D protein n=1 Tax=Brassica napus TaxID=3708 RepID=A0A078FY78_BRANA|nr:BnaC03g30430D [Brassica napus]
MIFNSLLQLSINVGMKPGLVMKPLPKSLDVVSLGKVLGNKTETWMISVCMSEHSESVNGAKPGQKDAQEQSGSTTSSSSKELSLVIANVNDPKMTEAKQEDRKHTKKDIALVFFRGSSIAKVIIPNTKIVHGYDPFAPIDKKRTNVLVDWLKLDLLWYYILRSLLAWLTDSVSYKHFANLKSLGGGRCGCGCFICASELQQRSLDCYMDIDPQQTHNRYSMRHDVVTVVCSP